MKPKFRKFTQDDDKPSTSEFWYDISSGGYLKASDFSSDKATIDAIKEAVKLLQECEKMCELQ